MLMILTEGRGNTRHLALTYLIIDIYLDPAQAAIKTLNAVFISEIGEQGTQMAKSVKLSSK